MFWRRLRLLGKNTEPCKNAAWEVAMKNWRKLRLKPWQIGWSHWKCNKLNRLNRWKIPVKSVKKIWSQHERYLGIDHQKIVIQPLQRRGAKLSKIVLQNVQQKWRYFSSKTPLIFHKHEVGGWFLRERRGRRRFHGFLPSNLVSTVEKLSLPEIPRNQVERSLWKVEMRPPICQKALLSDSKKPAFLFCIINQADELHVPCIIIFSLVWSPCSLLEPPTLHLRFFSRCLAHQSTSRRISCQRPPSAGSTPDLPTSKTWFGWGVGWGIHDGFMVI